MIRSILVAALCMAPIAQASTNAGDAVPVNTPSGETVNPYKLDFNAFDRYFYSLHTPRGQVTSRALNKLSAGIAFSSYDETMVFRVGMYGMSDDYCNDADVKAAINTICRESDTPTLKSVQDALKLLHEWLTKQLASSSTP